MGLESEWNFIIVMFYMIDMESITKANNIKH